jgi:hypothetical protein
MQLFSALEALRLSEVMLHADAPEVLAVRVMSMADVFLKPHTRVAFRVFYRLWRALSRAPCVLPPSSARS